jgi:thiol:disulfide interchange protein DsbC
MMMNRRKISLPFYGFVAMLVAALPVQAAESDEELDGVRQKVSSLFDMIAPEDVNPSPIDGWYTIQKGSIVAYVSADGRYLLQGDLIDLDNQVNLTEASRNDSRRQVMAAVADEQTIVFAPEEVKYKVDVFTDVDCTFCRRLHSQIEDYLARGIEVRYLLYPRNGPTSPSWSTAEEVWCSPDRNTALTMAKLDRKFASEDCDASVVQSHWSLGHEVGLTGTPAIVLDDGSLISGYLPPDQLEARLDQMAARP